MTTSILDEKTVFVKQFYHFFFQDLFGRIWESFWKEHASCHAAPRCPCEHKSPACLAHMMLGQCLWQCFALNFDAAVSRTVVFSWSRGSGRLPCDALPPHMSPLGPSWAFGWCWIITPGDAAPTHQAKPHNRESESQAVSRVKTAFHG